jgi:hypothetical protein
VRRLLLVGYWPLGWAAVRLIEWAAQDLPEATAQAHTALHLDDQPVRWAA